MPRFVLLYHDCPPGYERPSHWDLMFESGDVLRTWSLARLPRDWSAVRSRTAANDPECPALAAESTVVAVELGDHRRDFLEFEGPLSAHRGTVNRVAAGNYSSENESPHCWRIALSGDELSGVATLTQLSAGDVRWTFEYAPTA